eukprot:TRINITY_DN15942_c0_g1_i1.p1 TRINITY_DN15942_c0_g1~~TRINITY_DN15942_c0_g1_i1.p1  ORF type:complete len:764 (+),score=275.85 TRINITY_DN15942_c0_g1_i1:99-2390(+)
MPAMAVGTPMRAAAALQADRRVSPLGAGASMVTPYQESLSDMGGLTTSSFDMHPDQVESALDRTRAGLATLRQARSRYLHGEDLKVQLSKELRATIERLDKAIPEMEEMLLQRLRVVGRVSAYDDPGDTSYAWVRETREACEKVETDLQYLIDRRSATQKFLTQFEEVGKAAVDSKGCSIFAYQAFEAILAELRQEGGFSDGLWTSPYVDRVLAPSEVYEERLFTERNRSVNLTFNSGLTAICVDETVPGEDINTLFLGFEHGTVVAYDLLETTVAAQYQGHLYPIIFLKVIRMRDVPCIVSSSRDKCVKISEVKTKKVRYCLTEHAGLITNLHYMDNTLYTASLDGTLSWWHPKGYREGNIVSGVGICSTIFVDAGDRGARKIVAGDRDGAIRVYGLANAADAGALAPKPTPGNKVGKVVATETVRWRAHRGRVSAMIYENDFIITGGEDSRIYIWDALGIDRGEAGSQVHLLSYHIDTVLDLQVSEKGVLFSAGADAVIVMWDLRTGHIVQILSDHYHHVTGLAMVKLSSKTLEKLETSTTKLSELLSLNSLQSNEPYIENSCLKGRNKRKKNAGEKKAVTFGELPKKDDYVVGEMVERREKKKRYVKERASKQPANTPPPETGLRDRKGDDGKGGRDGRVGVATGKPGEESRDDMVSSWDTDADGKQSDAESLLSMDMSEAAAPAAVPKRFVLLSVSLDKSINLWTLHEYAKNDLDADFMGSSMDSSMLNSSVNAGLALSRPVELTTSPPLHSSAPPGSG